MIQGSQRTSARRSHLIALVGNDGAGKSTQARRLGTWLQASGHPTHVHPNESLRPIKEALGEIAARANVVDPETLLGLATSQLVYAAIKWNTMIKVRDWLDTPGQFVVMDRYAYCHVASVRAQRVDTAALVEQLFEVMPRPDLTLWVKVSPRTALDRIAARGTPSERMTIEYLQAHAEAYAALADAAGFVCIDGERPAEEVAAEIQWHVRTRFGI